MRPETVEVPVDLNISGRALRIWAVEKVIQLHVGHGWEAERPEDVTRWADSIIQYVDSPQDLAEYD